MEFVINLKYSKPPPCAISNSGDSNNTKRLFQSVFILSEIRSAINKNRYFQREVEGEIQLLFYKAVLTFFTFPIPRNKYVEKNDCVSQLMSRPRRSNHERSQLQINVTL